MFLEMLEYFFLENLDPVAVFGNDRTRFRKTGSGFCFWNAPIHFLEKFGPDTIFEKPGSGFGSIRI